MSARHLICASIAFGAVVLVGVEARAQIPQIPYLPPIPNAGYGYPPPPPPMLPPPARNETPLGVIAGGVVGFRAARLDADVDGAEDSYGFMGSASGVAIGSLKYLTGRLGVDVHVGGGDQGVEPRIGGHLTFGVIGHLAQTNGLFIRAGVGGNYEGNDRYFFSHLDLPLAEGGWQLHTTRFGLEVGVRGGATLTGRLGIAPTANRELGVEGRWGGFVTLATGSNASPYPGLWLDAEFMRLEADTPIHVASGRVCGGFAAFLCVDGRILHADLPFGPGSGIAGTHEDAVTLYAGLTLGWGAAIATDGVSELSRL